MNSLILLVPFLFIGCTFKETPNIVEVKEIIIKQNIPQELLTCKELPIIPTVKLQSELMKYVIDLQETADSCKTQIYNINDYININK